MKTVLWSLYAMLAAVTAAAQEPAREPVCLAIDEAHDTFAPQDRRAALLLVAGEFERAGRRVVAGDCAERYTLSHVRLGNTITVTVAGRATQRQGRAAG